MSTSWLKFITSVPYSKKMTESMCDNETKCHEPRLVRFNKFNLNKVHISIIKTFKQNYLLIPILQQF